MKESKRIYIRDNHSGFTVTNNGQIMGNAHDIKEAEAIAKAVAPHKDIVVKLFFGSYTIKA